MIIKDRFRLVMEEIERQKDKVQKIVQRLKSGTDGKRGYYTASFVDQIMQRSRSQISATTNLT